jgi:hypothetical protein
VPRNFIAGGDHVYDCALPGFDARYLAHAGIQFPGELTKGPVRASWLSIWRPYWLAKRRIPDWLPIARRVTRSKGYELADLMSETLSGIPLRAISFRQ